MHEIKHLVQPRGGGKGFKLRKGCITDVKADVLVSPCTPCVNSGFGVSRDIVKEAGPEVLRAAQSSADELRCKLKISIKGDLPPGTVIFSSAGKLNDVNYICHAVTTKSDHKHYFRSSNEIVRNTISNVLNEADSLEQKSIALPLLGAGFGGLDKMKVAEIIASESVKFLNEQAKNIEDIVLVVKKDAHIAVKKAIKSMFMRDNAE